MNEDVAARLLQELAECRTALKWVVNRYAGGRVTIPVDEFREARALLRLQWKHAIDDEVISVLSDKGQTQ